jgi:hypothetical protein
MADESKAGVAAELLLRKPSSESFNRVADFLQRHGVIVTTRGAASLSVRTSRDAFERLFQVRLRPSAGQNSPQGIRDFGRASGPAFAVDGEPVVPSAIAGDVEGIYLQNPGRLL